jgi:hypothetical protein
MWKIFSVPCGSALYKFHCTNSVITTATASTTTKLEPNVIIVIYYYYCDRLSGLVARVPGYRSRGLGSIPGATGFSEK